MWSEWCKGPARSLAASTVSLVGTCVIVYELSQAGSRGVLTMMEEEEEVWRIWNWQHKWIIFWIQPRRSRRRKVQILQSFVGGYSQGITGIEQRWDDDHAAEGDDGGDDDAEERQYMRQQFEEEHVGLHQQQPSKQAQDIFCQSHECPVTPMPYTLSSTIPSQHRS
jgi:hypothetical protein